MLKETLKMRAVILPGKKEVQVVDRPKPVPGDGQVLVRMRASAICRSDMSLYYGGKPLVGGEAAKTGTIIPGHELRAMSSRSVRGLEAAARRPRRRLSGHWLRALHVLPERLFILVFAVEMCRF